MTRQIRKNSRSVPVPATITRFVKIVQDFVFCRFFTRFIFLFNELLLLLRKILRRWIIRIIGVIRRYQQKNNYGGKYWQFRRNSTCGTATICAMTTIPLWNKRSRWNSKTDWKIYLADCQRFSQLRTPYAYPLRRGFLFVGVCTFASSTNGNGVWRCSLTYWYILSPLIRGGYEAGFNNTLMYAHGRVRTLYL